MPSKKEKNSFKAYAKYSNIAIQMIVIIVFGTFAGFKLDGYLHLKFPIFTLVLALGSVALAIYITIKDLIK
jgi:F0F1-type ATP synthase assembly protein I